MKKKIGERKKINELVNMYIHEPRLLAKPNAAKQMKKGTKNYNNNNNDAALMNTILEVRSNSSESNINYSVFNKQKFHFKQQMRVQVSLHIS